MNDYWLHDNPNPHGRWYYPKRTWCRHGLPPDRLPHLLVVHTAETLPDFTPPDTKAETIARYASTTERRVSWHYTIDSDSMIPMLPAAATAWHVRGFNSCSVGVEIATMHTSWATAPKSWVAGVVAQFRRMLADLEGQGVELDRVRLRGPDPGTAFGYIGHSDLDPKRRRDPGPDFPWQQFLDGGEPVSEVQVLRRGSRGKAVEQLQKRLIANGFHLPMFGADGVFGAETALALIQFQTEAQLEPTGICDGLTMALLQGTVF